MSLFERAEALQKRLNRQLEEHNFFGTTAIIEALQAQDKITRHACADAVASLPNKRIIRSGDKADYCVWLDEAHAACINVKTE